MTTDALNILIVDDDEGDRLLEKRVLAAADVKCEVAEAANVADAVRMLGENHFDCILLDQQLPDSNGLGILNQFHDAGVTAPIIMITDQGDDQMIVELMMAGASDYLQKRNLSPIHLISTIRNAVRLARAEEEARVANVKLLEQTRIAEALYRIGVELSAERDLPRLVQLVTDATTQLIGAQFGSFFYNVLDDRGESYMLYTLSGVPKEQFSKFPMPRNTEVFGPTFRGEGIVRLDDVTKDSRYGKNPPYHGMPPGHLPVRSYMAAPVISRSGEVLGGLFFGHETPGMFTAREEQFLSGIASQASVAIDNARLYDQLRRREEQYRFLAESIPQIIWTAEPDGEVDYFNHRWLEFTGLSIEQSLKQGWMSFVHPDDLERCRNRWQESLTRHSEYESECLLRRHSDGAYRSYLIRAVPMRDSTGQVVKWFATATDIHDWRVAEEALRISRERMNLVLNASALGLWYCDLPFDKLIWNDKCKLHFQVPLDADVTIDTFYQHLHPEDRDKTRAAIDQSVEQHSSYDIIYRTIDDAQTNIKWIRAIGWAFFDPMGKPIRFDGITVDVTDVKQAEQSLRAAKDAAEAANHAKDRFLAVLSHELRTPLMPVLTTVQTLEMEPRLSADFVEGLRVIRRNIELEARLIDDLLDLTRISKGKLQLNFDAVDLHAVIRSAMEICSPDLMGKNLGSSLDLQATRHIVRGDPARLQQVLWNLLKNAVKFTQPGGYITVRTFDDPGGGVKVQVADTGIGIEPNALMRIFDAFEQANRAVTQQFGGLGLGLAISKALIDLHGGKLSADSPGVNRGSTFIIEMRPVAATVAPQSEAPSSSAAGQSTASAPASIRILLVDDHVDTNRAMARLLQRLGYHVQTADSVQSALDAANADRYDLLISDIGLPDGSGLELMRQLLQQQSIKGIALSGFGMEEDIKKSKDAGFYEHLTKPINFKRLETAIQDLTAK